MDQDKFNSIWEECGLADYYSKMDLLEEIGFDFNGLYGEMAYDQSLIFNECLGDRNIIDVTKDEVLELGKLAKSKYDSGYRAKDPSVYDNEMYEEFLQAFRCVQEK